MRTQAFPPQILGAPVAVNRLTSSTPYYYSPPAADADGNYSASFSLWDGGSDGAVIATDALTLGRWPGADQWWGQDGAGKVTRWSVVGSGVTIARDFGPTTFPNGGTTIFSARGGIVALGADKIGVLGGGSTCCIYTSFDGAAFGVASVSASAIGYLTSTRAVLWSMTLPLAAVANNGTTSLVNAFQASGAPVVGAASAGSTGCGGSTDQALQRNSDTHLLVREASTNAVIRYLSGWTAGAIYSLGAGSTTVEPLSSTRLVHIYSSSRIDVLSLTGTVSALAASTTSGITIAGTVVGAVRLSLNEFLVLSTDTGALKATRFVVDGDSNIDSTAPTINSQGVQSVVLPFNRVLLHYGPGNDQTGWRSKVLRSLA